MTFKFLALVVEHFFETFIEFRTVKYTWSAKVKFLHRFVKNSFR